MAAVVVVLAALVTGLIIVIAREAGPVDLDHRLRRKLIMGAIIVLVGTLTTLGRSIIRLVGTFRTRAGRGR